MPHFLMLCPNGIKTTPPQGLPSLASERTDSEQCSWCPALVRYRRPCPYRLGLSLCALVVNLGSTRIQLCVHSCTAVLEYPLMLSWLYQ